MSLYERVPQLDLSPEYDGPVYSPTRPGDYLRVLREVFTFPQRVRDYARTYARGTRGETPPPEGFSLSDWLDWLHHSPAQFSFLWILTMLMLGAAVVIPNAAGLVAARLAQTSLPFAAMAASVWLMILLGLLVLASAVFLERLLPGVELLLVLALPFAVGLGLFWLAITAASFFGLGAGLNGLLFLGGCYGLALGAAASNGLAAASIGRNGRLTHTVSAVLLAFLSAWIVIASANGEGAVLLTGAYGSLFVVTALAYLLGALRPVEWLMHGTLQGVSPSAEAWLALPRVTPLPIRGLHEHLTAWLDFDWKRGMENAAGLWRYTGQQETVRRALHEILRGDRLPAAGAPLTRLIFPQPKTAPKTAPAPSQPGKPDEKQADKIVEMVGFVADDPARFPWEMVSFDSPVDAARTWWRGRVAAPLRSGTPYVQRRQKRQQLRQRALHRGLAQPLPSTTPEEAVTAGFSYLSRGYLTDAVEAFKKAPASPLGKEMQSLVEALNVLSSEENLLSNAGVKLPQRPKEPRRKASWDALEKVQQVVMFGRLARQSVSQSKREFAADEARRLLGELSAGAGAPAVEMRHLQRLAELWEADLSEWLAMSGEPQPIKPVDNPFIFAEPLRKQQMFVNRERELAELRLAWNQENLQPVVLFGQPLVGKTSLLYNARQANPHVELAWFHLGHSNRERAGIRSTLAAICAAVQEATILDVLSLDRRRAASLPAIESASDPFAETERFIRQACSLLSPRVLILIMDDFDAVQRLFINAEELDHLLDFLEHLFQIVKNFSVVFVSQHAPVLFEDRFSHNFAGTARIHSIGLLDRAHVAKLLRPAGLQLWFSDDAVDAVHRLTGGHPYLVQLTAHTLVQRFNRRAADKQGDPLVDEADVADVLGEPELALRGQNLYRRMRDLARQAGPQAEALLGAIAADPNGSPRAELGKALVPDLLPNDDALGTLLWQLGRYGMVEEDAGGAWRLRMELWRRWEQSARALPALTDLAEES